MAEDYIIQFGQDSSEAIEKVEDLFHPASPRADKFTKEYLTWRYLDNPSGHVASFNAWIGDDGLAAHYAAIPVRMVIGGWQFREMAEARHGF